MELLPQIQRGLGQNLSREVKWSSTGPSIPSLQQHHNISLVGTKLLYHKQAASLTGPVTNIANDLTKWITEHCDPNVDYKLKAQILPVHVNLREGRRRQSKRSTPVIMIQPPEA